MDGGRAACPGIHRWYLSFCPFSCPFSPSRSSSYWNIEARTHTCDPNNCASLEKTRSKENVGENAPTRTGDQWDGINGRVGSTPVPEKTSRAQKAERRKSKETRETGADDGYAYDRRSRSPASDVHEASLKKTTNGLCFLYRALCNPFQPRWFLFSLSLSLFVSSSVWSSSRKRNGSASSA